MIIREAILEDAFRIREMATRFLLDSQYGELFHNERTPDAIGKLIEQVMAIGTIFIAEHEQNAPRWVQGLDAHRVVGMLAIVIVPHPLSGEKVAEEIAWWVEPQARGGMVGPHMLRSAEEWATRNGANVVKMVAPAASAVGIFYERSGYRAVETAYIKRI